MTEDEFKKEVDDLIGMLDDLRRIKDKGRTLWLKRELRVQFLRLMRRF